MHPAMNQISRFVLILSALTLTACDGIGKQWLDPDKTFALFDQPKVKSMNDTQEEMAKEAMKAGDYNRARQFYQQLVDAGKATPEQALRYKLGLAECTRRLGETERALAMYDELHQQNDGNVDIAEGRGLTLMAAGKTTDAGRAFAEVMEKDPKRWRTLNALGILFVTKNMVPEAMAYYTEALNQSPDNAAVLNNVGLSQAVDRNFPRAIEALQQASRVSKIPSQRKQIELNLAMVYGVSGDLDTARDVAGKYLEGPALDNNLGLYAHLAKDDALAKSYLNMALSQSPTYYERAWENLDAISNSSRDVDGPIDNKLPSTEALKSAEPAKEKAAAKEKEKTTTKTKRGKTETKPAAKESDPVAETKPAEKPEVKPEAKPVEKPEAKPAAEERKTPSAQPDAKADKPATEKPAGLIVAPGE